MSTVTLNCRPSFTIRPPFRSGECAEADPFLPLDEPEDPSDLEEQWASGTDDDAQWDVFLPEDDPYEPLPEQGDFWIDSEE